MQTRIFKLDINIKDEGLYRGIEIQAHWSISSISSIFLSFCISHVNIANLSDFSQILFKLEILNFVYIWTMSCCITELRIRLIVLILPFKCP